MSESKFTKLVRQLPTSGISITRVRGRLGCRMAALTQIIRMMALRWKIVWDENITNRWGLHLINIHSRAWFK
jgi:hypothetical protein